MCARFQCGGNGGLSGERVGRLQPPPTPAYRQIRALGAVLVSPAASGRGSGLGHAGRHRQT